MNSSEDGNEVLIEDTESGSKSDELSATREIQKSQSPDVASTGEKGLAGDQKAPRAVSRQGTGPRTSIGKGGARYNALKHGLFSKVVLLSHEPRSQFDALLRDLQNDLKPEGALERTLVEKLATILWRYRRFLQAENAELLKNIGELDAEKAEQSDRRSDFDSYHDEYIAKTDKEGLIRRINDPNVLESCLKHLRDVRMEVGKFGVDDDTGQPVALGLVYGARYSGRPGKDLFDYFLACLSAIKATAAERQKMGFTSGEDCANKFLAETDKEIHRLEGLRKYPLPKPKRRVDELKPTRTELLKCAIPNSIGSERLLRYETSVERALDRTLAQIERLQQNRFNQKTIDIPHQIMGSE
jgi:hypothetical protein